MQINYSTFYLAGFDKDLMGHFGSQYLITIHQYKSLCIVTEPLIYIMHSYAYYNVCM